MAGDTRQLKVVIDGDGKGGQKALKTVDKGLEEVSTTQHKTHEGWKRLGTAIVAMSAVGAAAIGRLAAKSISAASDLAETSSKVDAIFLRSAPGIKAWADTAATAFGQSKQAAMDGASTFALYGKAAKMTGGSLNKFSTDLVGLASDMASFSNTSPEEAIAAIGSAMRGEMDPIERYNVLLNETALKNAALKLGIIKNTKQALTPQQRVLAVNAELWRQLGKNGTNAVGDFKRTQAGLANQQRILNSQWQNMKATIGNALLPIVTQFVTMLNTKFMPTLNKLWSAVGPKVTEFLSSLSGKIGTLIGKLGSINWGKLSDDALLKLKSAFDAVKNVDWKGLFEQIKQAVAGVSPKLKELSGNTGTLLSDGLSVGAVALKFFADHAKLLGDLLPYLIAGFLLFKTAQAGYNIVSALSPAFTIADTVAKFRLASANSALTASLMAQTAALEANAVASGANTVATTAGDVATKRSIISSIGAKLAMIGGAIATGVATAAQWLLNIALLANPIGLIILAIVALVAMFVLLYKKNAAFRAIVQAVWAAIKTAVGAVVNWLKVVIPAVWAWIVKATKAAFEWVKTYIIGPIIWVKNYLVFVFNFYKALFVAVWSFIIAKTSAAWNWITSTIGGAINAARNIVFGVIGRIRDGMIITFNQVKAKVLAIWNGLKSAIGNAITKVMTVVIGLRDKVLGVFKNAKDWLLDVGKKIIDGLLSGISSGFKKVKDKLGELTKLLPDWKGPAEKDAVLLRPAGRMIMGGLVSGFQDATPTVHGSLTKLTTDIGSQGLASASLSSGNLVGSGGVTVIVNVAGSVATEKDLAEAIAVPVRDAIARKAKRNGGKSGIDKR